MRILDILSLSFRTIRSNKLRTGITVAIIAFGIMALVGINTAIDAMKQKFTESFASMGSNGFTIHYKDYQFFGNNNQVTKEKKEPKKIKSPIIKYPLPRIRRNSSNKTITSLPKYPSVCVEATAISFHWEVQKPIRRCK